MKRIISFTITILLVFGVILSLSGCSKCYCNPGGKEWYNTMSLPNISYPFNELYDGSYSIRIDKDGNVVFKTLDGVEIEGSMTVTPDDRYSSADVSINFENGITATGFCFWDVEGRVLVFEYDSRYYHFTEKQVISKEEFLEYRAGFVQFLQSVYDSGVFPTQEEIEENSLYCEYTHLYQIDPCCGGPIVYTAATKATIEKIDLENFEITVRIDDATSYTCWFDEDIIIVNVKNGELEKLTPDDLVEADCLVVGYFTEANSRIEEIFYFEND